MFSMVTISENTYSKVPSHLPRLHRKSGSGPEPAMNSEGVSSSPSESFTEAFLRASKPQYQLPTPVPSVTTSMTAPKDEDSDKVEEIRLMDFIDVPSLVSDDEEEESETESHHSSKETASFPRPTAKLPPALAAAEEVKRSLKEEAVPETEPETKKPEKEETKLAISEAQFRSERSQLMKIAVKYVAMKITNSFPPELARKIDPTEMPLDTFLLILTSRLQLTLPLFMKGIIYLFRYMDIIYLLRYLNQSNNFLNYTEMGFGLKKLIVGCFKLTLAREKIGKDWSGVTGLANSEINTTVKTVVKRLNGKLAIKNIELLRLKSEIYRFVKMVVKETD